MTDLAAHPDAVAFVRAVCSVPPDDTPRLVYADWLQEHGDADRAAFIRVQCELARVDTAGERCGRPPLVCGESDCPQCQLRRREQQFYRDHHRTLLIGLPPGWVEWASGGTGNLQSATHYQFSRGFVAALTCSAEEWLRVADQVFWHPDQTVPCGNSTVYRPLGPCCPVCGGGYKGVSHNRVPRPFPAGEGRTAECPECHGAGMIEYRDKDNAIDHHICGRCAEGRTGYRRGTGRVPAPAALPHPLETVILTTNPNANIVGPDLLGHFDRDGGPFIWNDGRWKWIKFVVGWALPTPA